MPVKKELLDVLRKDKQQGEFLYPYYEKFSTAEIGPTVLDLFNASEGRAIFPFAELQRAKNPNQKIIFLLIDGLGFNHFCDYSQEMGLFKILAERGTVYPITTVFPSTTPAAMTTIHTGLTPQEHGLPEMTVYFEELDRIIETLPFKAQDMADMDELVKHGGVWSMLYEGPTIYSKLRDKGIPSFNFLKAAYETSTYTKTSTYGSTVISSSTGPEFIDRVVTVLKENAKGPAYFFLYWGQVDTISHAYGPESLEHVSAIAEINDLMMGIFSRLSPQDSGDTLFFMSADHGHSAIKAEDIINLNKYSVIEDSFKLGKNGRKILPNGSPHDVFLHIDPAKVQQVISFLQQELGEKAEVMSIESALHQGLFGLNMPIPRFINRVGNVLILPRKGYHVWYEFLPEKPFVQLGVHGGLSEEEMLVPLAVAELSNLVGS